MIKKLFLKKFLTLFCVLALFGNEPSLAMQEGSTEDQSFVRKAPTIPFGTDFSLHPLSNDLNLAPIFCDIYTQEVASQYENGQAWDLERAKKRIASAGPRLEAWEKGDNKALPWALIYKGSNPIGVFKAAYNKNELYPNQLEIACALKKDFWGKGVALNAGLGYGSIFLLPLLKECKGIYATVHPDNQKSRRAMEKRGFVLARNVYTPQWAKGSEDPIYQRVV